MIALRLPRHSTRYLTVSAAALLAGCAAKPDTRPPRAAVTVTVVPVRRTSVPYTIDANGIVTPMQTATVVSQVDGLITEVAFAEGQNVTKGQVLFRIEARQYKAAYDQAIAALQRDQVTLTYAKEQSARYDTLAAAQNATREQADQFRATASAADATVAADRAAVENAKFNLDNTTIRAPISGRTGSLLVHVGNLARAAGGTPLVVINLVQPTLVRFSVPAASLSMLLKYGAKGGLPVTAVPTDQAQRAPPDSTIPRQRSDSATPGPVSLRPTGRAAAATGLDDRGVLSFIDNAVDTTTGTVQLKATFPNRSGMLWAGQFVSTSLRLFVQENALVVPTIAVVTGQTGPYVWVIDSGNVAHNKPVSVERAAGDMSVISSGVDAGERVVVSGQSRLTPGSTVSLGGRGDSTAAGRRDTSGGRRRDTAGGRGKNKAPVSP
ncbi:MAG: efflux RND transporter periplasmic adaptor subunit [Gemmatimonadota bacterium]